jgi:hypothetical protein
MARGAGRKWLPKVGERVRIPLAYRNGIEATVVEILGKGDHAHIYVEEYIDGGMEDEQPHYTSYPIRFVEPVDKAA